MLQNVNGKFIKNLAKKNLKSDRIRNLFLVSTIFFAVCLMSSLALYVFAKSYELNNFLRGRYQAAIISIDDDKVKNISKDEDIEAIGKEMFIGKIRVKNFDTSIYYRDQKNIELTSTKISGSLPKKYNEIVISESLLKKINIQKGLNDLIKLSLPNSVEDEYKISGIIEDDEINQNYQLLISSEYLYKNYTKEFVYNGLIRLRDSSDLKAEELKAAIISCLSKYGISEQDIAFSSSYFNSVDNSTRDTISVIVLCLLIAFSCSLVIYSIFYISVIGKVQEYGRLRLIGMTSKQIKKMVKNEGIYLALRSIPIGILVSCVLVYILIPNGWNWSNVIKCIFVVTVLTLFTILLSIRKPIKIASSISPIEAVRIATTNNRTIAVKARKKCTFITPKILAKKNFTQNRKKIILTMFSLGFTGVFLITAATYLNSLDAENMARQTFGDREIKISLEYDGATDDEKQYVEKYTDLQESNPLNEDLVNKLSENPAITGITSVESCQSFFYLPNNLNVERMPQSHIGGIKEEDISKYHEYLEEGTIDYEQLLNNHGILVDDSAGILKQFCNYDVKLNDKIQLETNTGQMLTFTVMGIVDWKNSDYSGFYFVIPQDYLKELKTNVSNFNSRLLIDSEDVKSAEKYIKEECSSLNNLVIESFSTSVEYMQLNIDRYKGPIYILVLFVGIFAIINLVNTLMTNLVSRRRELVILRSVGLAKEQLFRTLWIECFYYVMGTIVITLTIGSLSGYAICLIFDQIGIFGKSSYHYPFLETSIFCIALFFILIIYSYVATFYCNRQSIVANLKND